MIWSEEDLAQILIEITDMHLTLTSAIDKQLHTPSLEIPTNNSSHQHDNKLHIIETFLNTFTLP
jgi:hypothetical protein